jgi:hypothetical protein
VALISPKMRQTSGTSMSIGTAASSFPDKKYIYPHHRFFYQAVEITASDNISYQKICTYFSLYELPIINTGVKHLLRYERYFEEFSRNTRN